MISRRSQIDDVPGFLRGLGIKGVKDGPEVAFCCPFHGDNDPSASMNKMTTAWFCHGCHEKGNAVTLAKKLGGEIPFSLGLPDDEDDLLAYVHELTRDEIPQIIDHQEPPKDPIDWEYEKGFRVDWDVQRKKSGFLWEIMRDRYKFLTWQECMSLLLSARIGYDPFSNRIVIPMWDQRGLWGFKARAIGDAKPRYIALGNDPYGFKPFKSGDLLFMWNPTTTPSKTLYIVEGEFNALVVSNLVGSAAHVVGLSGSVLTKQHVSTILDNPPGRVVLYFDDDMPGATGAWHAYKELSPHMEVLCIGPHSQDACDTPLASLRMLINFPVDPLMRLIGDDTWAKASKTS